MAARSFKKLSNDELRLIIHHYAVGKKGREFKEWATAANEVFLNRLVKGRLYHGNNEGWDGETKKLLINYKLLTGPKNENKDGFDGEDVKKVLQTRELEHKDKNPFARATLVSIPGNQHKNN